VQFPRHAASLHLTHNQHKSYYETVAKAIESGTYDDEDWINPEQRQRALETNDVWELQWYPDTPVGSYRLLAADLDALLTAAVAVEG